MRAWSNLACAVALMAAPSGCTAIVDAGEFEERQEPLQCGTESSGVRDMVVTLTDMGPHAENLVVLDLVRDMGGGPPGLRQVGRVIYDPLVDADVVMRLPCTVRDGNHVVDLWADLNMPGGELRKRDVCTEDDRGLLSCDDHQWRIELQGNGTLEYKHDTRFEDVVSVPVMARGPLPFRATLMELDRFAGRLFELHVRLAESDDGAETIFVYRGTIPETGGLVVPPANLEIAPREENTLLEQGERLNVAIWIDENGNGVYDPPTPGRDGRDFATVIDSLAEPLVGALVMFNGTTEYDQVDVRF